MQLQEFVLYRQTGESADTLAAAAGTPPGRVIVLDVETLDLGGLVDSFY